MGKHLPLGKKKTQFHNSLSLSLSQSLSVPDKLCCQKMVFNKHVIIAFAVSGVSVAASVYSQNKLFPWKKSQTNRLSVIHGEQITSFEVYVNEIKPKYHRVHKSVSLFCLVSYFVLSERCQFQGSFSFYANQLCYELNWIQTSFGQRWQTW